MLYFTDIFEFNEIYVVISNVTNKWITINKPISNAC